MKHGGPYKTTDCIRNCSDLADAQGRLLYIAPAEDEKRPCRSGKATGPKPEQNVHADYSMRKEKKQCRK